MTQTPSCSAEGSGPRRAAGVCVSPAGRRQTHRGDPQGQEPPQDGHHRHVRWGEERQSAPIKRKWIQFMPNLFAIYSISSLADPYVKIYLLHKDQRISKKKTHVKKRTLNPVFNESFVFDLPRTDNGVADVQLEFALLDWDRVTKNEVLGIESFMSYFANFPN